MKKKSLGIVFVVMFFGCIISSATGEIIALIIPEGVVKEFFLRSVTIGFDAVTLNLGILNFTIGFNFILNVVGVFGIGFTAYLLRWYYGHRL